MNTPFDSKSLVQFSQAQIENRNKEGQKHKQEKAKKADSFLAQLSLDASNKGNTQFARTVKIVLNNASITPAKTTIYSRYLDRGISSNVMSFINNELTQQFITDLSDKGKYSSLTIKNVVKAYCEVYMEPLTLKDLASAVNNPPQKTLLDIMEEKGKEWIAEVTKQQIQESKWWDNFENKLIQVSGSFAALFATIASSIFDDNNPYASVLSILLTIISFVTFLVSLCNKYGITAS